MKPALKPADALLYERVRALAEDTPVTFQGRPAKFLGMTGYLITIKPRGHKIIYLRAGDPRIAEIRAA